MIKKLIFAALCGACLLSWQGGQEAQAGQGEQEGQCSALGREGAQISVIKAHWEELGAKHGEHNLTVSVLPGSVIAKLRAAGINTPFDLDKVDKVTAFIRPADRSVLLLALQVGDCSLALIRAPGDFLEGLDG